MRSCRHGPSGRVGQSCCAPAAPGRVWPVRTSISAISTRNATFAEDVAAYAAAGVGAMGIWELKLGADDDASLALLREHGLGVANCVPRVPSVLPLNRPGMELPADPHERIALLCASIRRLAAFEPESVVVLAGPLGHRTREEGVALVREGFRQAAAVAREVGVRLAFEPVHPSQELLTGFVTSLAFADEVLAAPGLEQIGILFDTYHVCDDPTAEAWLAANHHRVAALHVSDWPAAGDSAARADGARLLPDPALPTGGSARLVRALVATGWDGSIDIEIFSTPSRFWGLPVAEAARQAQAAAAFLLA